jgi:hypothetical protein
VPSPVLVPEGAAQADPSLEDLASESSASKNVLQRDELQKKEVNRTKTVSIPLTCRVVRIVPEGICVEFIHRNGNQRLDLESFLLSVNEGNGIAKPNGRGKNEVTRIAIARKALSDLVSLFTRGRIQAHRAFEVVERLWAAAIAGRRRSQTSEPSGFVVPFPASVTTAARAVEALSGSLVAVPANPIRGTHGPIKWARLIPVLMLTLLIAWTLTRTKSGAARIPLDLQVISRGKQLEIHWNHDATTVRNAAKGVMRISDSGVEEVIDFDAAQLRDGAVAYSPKSNDVSVRFEVDGVDGTHSSESVRSVAIP